MIVMRTRVRRAICRSMSDSEGWAFGARELFCECICICGMDWAMGMGILGLDDTLWLGYGWGGLYSVLAGTSHVR